MVDTFDLTIHLLSGDKVYYNLSRVAVNHYLSYFKEKENCSLSTVELSLDSMIKRELRNYSRLESLTSH